MALNFPPSPSVNDEYTDPNGAVWRWNGSYWQAVYVDGVLWFPTGSAGLMATKAGASASSIGVTAYANDTGKIASLSLSADSGGDYNAELKVRNGSGGTLYALGLAVSAGGTFRGPRVYNGGAYVKVWYEDNDGAGSGLDADTVDGEQASAIVTEARIKAALANTADLQDTNVLQLKQNCDITADGGGAGTLYSTSVKNSTTAAAANMVIDATGAFIQRSTSSRRYKKNIRRAKFGLREVMKLRPVTYQGKGKLDGDKVHAGLIAEEVFAAGLPEFVSMKDGEPDGLAYGHMVALLVAAMQEQQKTIESLRARIDAIEG